MSDGDARGIGTKEEMTMVGNVTKQKMIIALDLQGWDINN